jgi:HPt (histidine-containing phosphotransfer) domain-containing protein
VLPPQRVASMLAMLPSEIERRLGEYRSALEAEDLPTARRAAHTLKGLAANFGAARLESVSRAAEAACGSLGSARAAVPLIEEAVRATAVVAGELSVAFGDRAAPGDPSGGQGTI